MNQPQLAKIDCVVRVVTPENIEFEYMLAGPFQRLPAFLVDFGLRTAIFFAIIGATLLVGVPIAGELGFMLAFTFGLLTFFLLSWLYGTILEAQFNGRTVGKAVFGLRTISSDGRPINGSQAALRNLLRLCDFMPPLSLTLLIPDAPPIDSLPTCFIGLAAMTLTQRMQRVGDLAANTMVVWEGRRGQNADLQPDDPRAYALAELVPPTFQVSRTLARAVALYMERRLFLAPLRREEIALNLAEPLFQQFELQPDTSADLLLCAIYVRIYHSQEQRAEQLAAARRKGAVPVHPIAFATPNSLVTKSDLVRREPATPDLPIATSGPVQAPNGQAPVASSVSAPWAMSSVTGSGHDPADKSLSHSPGDAEIIAAEVLNDLPIITARAVEIPDSNAESRR